MTIWHLVALVVAFAGYRRGNNIIEAREESVLWHKGIGIRPERMYREGDDAVAVGKIDKLGSVILAVTTLTDMAGLHDLTLYVFICLVLVMNIVTTVCYPAKSESSKKKKRVQEHDV